MRMKPAVASVVGPTTEKHWGQVLMLPQAYGVVEVKDDDGIARQIGVRALSILGEELTRGTVSLDRLRQITQKAANEGVETVLVLVPVGNIVYIALHGDGVVYVRRGNSLSKLLDSQSAISGETKVGDTFIVASKEFTNVLTHEEIGTLFDHLTPTEVAEKMTLMLHAKVGGEGSAALIYQASGFVEPDSYTEEPVVEESSGAPTKLSVLMDKIKGFFRPIVQRVHLRRFVRTIKEHPKKRIAFITITLGILFALSVTVGVIKQTSKAKNERVVSVLTQAQHAFDEGVALLDLNPIKGRERLTEAKNALESLVVSVPKRTKEGRQIDLLSKQIDEYLKQSLHSEQISLQLFYDVSLLKKGSTIGAFGLSGTTLALMDTTLGAVYQLDIISKKAQIIAGGESFKGALYVGIYGDKQYVLADLGIHEVRVGDKQMQAAIIKKSSDWGTIGSLVIFGGNIYLLDTEKGRIWKYVATEKAAPGGGQGFSDLREYLNPDTLPNLSHATSMAIDGSVWVGTSTGTIMRFAQGQEQTYIPKGIDTPLGSHLVVYTNDELKNLYVLDNQNKRVVLLDKEGMYLAQYVWADALTPSSLVVSEEYERILLLSDGKLYSIELK
jgi:hypothetical protein